MAATYTGSCSCGAIKIELQGEPSIQALCHCHDCHKSTGSTYSTNFIWSKSDFKIVVGEPKVYEKISDSGNPVWKQFCGTCGCPMWTRSSVLPDMVVIKAGILEDGALAKFAPAVETFTSRKPGWINSVEGAAQFAKMPPRPSSQ
ncbi:hypothetical protein MMC32_003697 [Xylographa parallela]|nr:hypothetical protein [Xylographa parallela]